MGGEKGGGKGEGEDKGKKGKGKARRQKVGKRVGTGRKRRLWSFNS